MFTMLARIFMAESFVSRTYLLHICTKDVPVKSASSMTIVERYHQPIRRAHKIIKSEGLDIDEYSTLRMAVEGIYNSVGPEGIACTLLVYDSRPHLGLPHNILARSTFQQTAALQKATVEMTRCFARSQVRSALTARNGPNDFETHSMPIGRPALVYRPKNDKWEGAFSKLDLQGEDVMLLLPSPSGPTKFWSTVVKPYFFEDNDAHTTLNNYESHALSVQFNCISYTHAAVPVT